VLHAFHMVLSRSRKPAIAWTRRQDELIWLLCHNESYRRLAGVAAINRIDNIKAAIVQVAGAWGVIHPTYRSYAQAVGFHIDACAPRQAQAKGKVEAKMRLSRLLLDLSRKSWDSLEELPASTDERLAWVGRAHAQSGDRQERARELARGAGAAGAAADPSRPL
jgi:transposase